MIMKAFFICLIFSFTLSAQLPETDIWLFKIEKKEGKYTYSNPLNITHRAGYDNQPTFSLDGKSILYVVIDSTMQADIYQYNIGKKVAVNLTKSKLSEYSPTYAPNQKLISTVTVELDSVQRIWGGPINGGLTDVLIPSVDSVGYYAWLNSDTLLYYKLTNPHSLRVLNIKTNEDHWICNHPTRAFKKIGNSSNFVYAIKDSIHTEFRIYYPALRESKLYTTYLSANEDFIWHPELGLIKSENADLMRYNEQVNKWELLFSFSDLGIKKITRFVFDSKTKQLAIVSNL